MASFDVAVLGTGSVGAFFGALLLDRGHSVTLVGRDSASSRARAEARAS